ncbi:unnamed protein product [Trichobilharzia regenti]|nr:unnamed protein product [Trichobilharzia regenti]
MIARQTLEIITNIAQHQFAKSDRYKLCRTLHDFLCEAISHFGAAYLIWDLWKSEHFPNGNNPFTEFLVSYLQDEMNCKLPRSAISMFHTVLHQPDHIRDVCAYIFDLQCPNIDTKLNWNIPSFNNSPTSSSRVSKLAASGLACVVPDNDVPNSFKSSFHLHKAGTVDSSNTADLQRIDKILYDLDEEFESPIHTDIGAIPVDKKSSAKKSRPTYGWCEELIWLNPDIVEHDFHWNSSVELVNMTVELRQLIATAMASTLTQSQQHTIVQAIKDNPNLPNLVNRNPVIAIEVLQLLITSPKRDE